jgi:hypothetical protein
MFLEERKIEKPPTFIRNKNLIKKMYKNQFVKTQESENNGTPHKIRFISENSPRTANHT